MIQALSLPLSCSENNEEGTTKVHIELFSHIKDVPVDDKLCVLVSDGEELSQLVDSCKLPSKQVVIYLPSVFEELTWSEEYASAQEYGFYIALLASTCSSEIKFVLPKIPSELPDPEVVEKISLACFDDFYIYDCHNFIVFSESPLPESAMTTGSGDRLRYLPSLRAESFATIEILISKSKVK